MKLLAILLLVLPFTSSAKAIRCKADSPKPQTGTVSRVVDGDTIKLDAGEGNAYSIRILGIDTPETHYNGMTQGYWGDMATLEMQRLTPVGSHVQLVYDREPCDGYGRYLAYVFSGQTDVGAVMIHQGLAINYCIWPNTSKCRLYGDIAARGYDKGVSLLHRSEIPYEWRARVRNRPITKPVADMRQYAVYDPHIAQKIWPFFRLFFFKWSDVHPPYYRYRNQALSQLSAE
jgi:endonuclease YncB( thermonuclease family)